VGKVTRGWGSVCGSRVGEQTVGGVQTVNPEYSTPKTLKASVAAPPQVKGVDKSSKEAAAKELADLMAKAAEKAREEGKMPPGSLPGGADAAPVDPKVCGSLGQLQGTFLRVPPCSLPGSHIPNSSRSRKALG